MNSPSVKNILLVFGLLFVLSPGLSLAADPSKPFASSCLSGRYVTASSGVDVTFMHRFAFAGMVNFECTHPGVGTFTGEITVTYQTDGDLTTSGGMTKTTCPISDGTYSIDAITGAFQSEATLVTGGGCIFSNSELKEDGYLSDPTAKRLYLVETGQGLNNALHFVYSKSTDDENKQ